MKTSDEDRSCQFGKMSAHTMCKRDQTGREHVLLLFDLLRLGKKKGFSVFSLLSSQLSDLTNNEEKKVQCSIYHCSCSY